jgi:hypothetical protein
MKSQETATTRLADALFVASVVINGAMDGDTSAEVFVARMLSSFEELLSRYGAGNVNLAAEVVEAAFELLCSEIFIEP